MALSNTLDQMDLRDIYKTFHPKIADYTFLSSTPGTFSKIDHMFSYKKISINLRRTETISSILSDHNGMKLGINWQKNFSLNTNVEDEQHATK